MRLQTALWVRFSVTQASNLSLANGAPPTPVAPARGCGNDAAWLRQDGQNLVEPINRIDLQAPLESQTYEELQPPAWRIGTQNEQTLDQMKTDPGA
ncbi:MAG: hypothetical protein ACLU9S_24085 [Oscillospiraceae bacterium]